MLRKKVASVTLQSDVQFWDRAAKKYAADPIADLAGYERTLEATRSRLKRSDVVIELGCGTGTTALHLAPSVQRLVATDISPQMIAIAQAKAAAQRNLNVVFRSAALEAEAEASARYDVVLAFNVLHLIPDIYAGLRTANRVLQPGGLLISKTPCLKLMHPLVRALVPAMRMLGRAPSSVSFYSPDVLVNAFATARFEILEQGWHGTNGKRDMRLYLVARKVGEYDP